MECNIATCFSMWVQQKNEVEQSVACVQKEDPSEWAWGIGAANKLNRWTRALECVQVYLHTRHLAEILISGRPADVISLVSSGEHTVLQGTP